MLITYLRAQVTAGTKGKMYLEKYSILGVIEAILQGREGKDEHCPHSELILQTHIQKGMYSRCYPLVSQLHF